ncbi:hypothetical protein ACFL3N_02500 [Candidatus Omnitrophota bacterium]
MLKRYQVLINDWLADHIKKISERYDISYSETIRGALCMAYLSMISRDYPGCKINIKEMRKRVSMKAGTYEKVGRDQFHGDMSRLYFEAHKAIEYFWAQEKKTKKLKSLKDNIKKTGQRLHNG